MEKIEKYLFDEQKGKGFLNIREPVTRNTEIIGYAGVKEMVYKQGDTRVVLFVPEIYRNTHKRQADSIRLFETAISSYKYIAEGSYFCDSDEGIVARVQDRDEANRLYKE